MPDPKQRDIELILRLFALFENVENYSPPMKDFLSREMAGNRDFDSERAARFVVAFRNACEIVVEKIDKPFRPRGLLNAATMEAVMLAVMENETSKNLDSQGYKALLQRGDFLELVTSNTTNIENVNARKSIAVEVLFGDE